MPLPMACSLTTHKFDDVCAECVNLNNPPYVNTYSPHAAFKHAILRKFAGIFNLRVFVETGTNRGDTVDYLKDWFYEMHSIELHPDLYNYAMTRFQDHKYIHIIHGNSAEVLGSVLDKIDRPALFWIDAHVAGYGTADAGDPIPQELQAIYEKSPDSLLVLDDRWPQDFEKLTVPEGWHKRWYHGLIFLHRGQYNISERF